MSYFMRPLTLFLPILLTLAAPLKAATIHIAWDPSVTAGYYRIRTGNVDFSHSATSRDELMKERHEDFTADLPEGHYRFEGPGFSTAFESRGREILFKDHGIIPAFNDNHGKITFNTATLKIDLGGYRQNVAVKGVTPVLDKATQIHTFKLVCGHHKLEYGGGSLTIEIDAKGVVRLPDNPGGFAVEASSVSLHPREFNFEPAARVEKWRLGRNDAFLAGPQTIKLLPTTEGYPLIVSSAGEKLPKFDLRINRSFQVQASTALGDPFAEFAEIKPEGASAPIMVVSLPGGRQIVKDRQAKEAAARKSFDTVCRNSMAVWHRDFAFDDALQIYPFPEELVSYRVKFPAAKILASELALLALNDQRAVSLPLQLSDVVESDGFLSEATVRFRANLPVGQKRLYRLTAGYNAVKVDPPLPIRLEKAEGNTARLITGLLQVHVPLGRLEFNPAKPLATAPAPIMSLTRIGGNPTPAVKGLFVAPHDVAVKSMESRLLETGPLLARYRISYHLTRNKTYEVTLGLRTAESYVTVDENLTGFDPKNDSYLQMRFASLRPTLRQALSNDGYNRYSGAYDKGVGRNGVLPVTLGLYCPNYLGIMRAAAFWDDQGADALLVSVNRLRDWKTDKRAVWASPGPGMLQFLVRDKEQYFQTRLEGTARYWALGLIPRDAVVNRPALATRSDQTAGPEVRLWQKLSDFSLDVWKDRVVDFDEPLDPGVFADAKLFTYGEWLREWAGHLRRVANQHWESDAIGPVTIRGAKAWFGSYARSRATWTPEQRRHARAMLLCLTYGCEDDGNLPHHSMLGGHPNFISDVKVVIPLACATFPRHPDAKKWRESFMGYFKEWLDTYQRSADPEHNALGGRWTESIACYSGQSLVGLLESHKAMAAYDGTDLINTNPRVADWLRWYRDVIMSPNDGVRLVPPQGAHSRAFEPGYRHARFRETLFEVAAILAKSNPRIAAEMLWIKTNGKEGTGPKAASCLYVDYGPVFHYDFGGPHESYATMQNIAGRGNYRWGSAGIVYYGAKNRAWSYNGIEDNGDDFSWDKVSAFTVKGQGLKPSPTDQILYDFGFAQFYRTRGEAPYLARSLMLLRDDYLMLCDEVSPDAPEGQFVWSSSFEMPRIYQLKPGASATETTSTEGQRPGARDVLPPRTSHQRKYVGKGDFLTVVAPGEVRAQAQPYGASVGGEYVFASQKPLSIDARASVVFRSANERDFRGAKGDDLVFSGNYGYARPGQVALFQGTRIAIGGLELRREGGDFGLSAAVEKSRIVGRIVGRSGGRVFVVPPEELPAAAATVTINGKPVPHTIEHRAVTFLVDIAQKDGLKGYVIQFGK